MEAVILKCIEKDPAKRFQSVLELDTALRAQFDSPAGASIAASSTSRGSGVAERTMQVSRSSAPARLNSPVSGKKSKWATAVVALAVAAVLAAVRDGRTARTGSHPSYGERRADSPKIGACPGGYGAALRGCR